MKVKCRKLTKAEAIAESRAAIAASAALLARFDNNRK